ncbi:MAG TPA: dethiobiotin synthase [Terriglobia bacterium]|nr:dethiobiotin synthase [Terriglobia bacterium]
MRDLFITGTDTNVGKTVLSALLVAALDRNYWKPIQTGASEDSDRRTVIDLAGIPAERAYPEAYIFDPPVSPHLAAEWKGVEIDLDAIRRPASSTPLVIEGAGGILVPINRQSLMLDLARHLDAPLVIATRTTLGTINHTLLTIAAIRNAKLKLNGVVMIGEENADNRRAIERYGNAPVIGWVPRLDRIDREALRSVFQHHFDARAFE